MSRTLSVVIPTYLRPDRLRVALQSVAAQTLAPDEVVVVVDGCDDESAGIARGFDALPVTTIVPERNLGNAEARNLGIAEARGEIIALLDDDDQWHADKLAVQVPLLAEELTIVSCRLEAVSEYSRFVWPRRTPGPDEAISEYLFCRRRPATGEGMAQTSTLVAPRSLFEAVPFTPGLKRYVDLDFMLRAGAAGAKLVFPEDARPLVTWSIEEDRQRISNETGWRWDLDFARERRALFTDRSYAAFLLTLASLTAARGGSRGAFLPLLREAMGSGRPSGAELAFHTANLALPLSLKRGLARLGSR
jgi:glycosyltransferase involved in cell wall biosynthesis